MKLLGTILFLFFVSLLKAQEANSFVKEGNDAYRKADYNNAEALYKKALGKEPANNAAKFNLGNALHKQNNFADAEKYYDEVALSNDPDLKAKALYNKGVAQVYQQKLKEAVETFKQSLMIDPADNDTRENLQKAINELKQQQQSSQPKHNQDKSQQNKNKNKQPDKEMMEQKFNELRDKEKQLQKMLQKKNNSNQPDKDW